MPASSRTTSEKIIKHCIYCRVDEKKKTGCAFTKHWNCIETLKIVIKSRQSIKISDFFFQSSSKKKRTNQNCNLPASEMGGSSSSAGRTATFCGDADFV